MKPITLDTLTPELKLQLKKEFEAEQKVEQQKLAAERSNYKKLVTESVNELFPVLRDASKKLSEAKKLVTDSLQTLVKMKAELYDKEENQTSHSFTSEDGSITITIGYNVNDGWDDTVNTGIAKVNDYLQSLATDRKGRNLVEGVMKLLAKDGKGNLKASRVLQLKQMADKSEDANFIDAIKIIQDAYRPVRTKDFVRCEYKLETGEKVLLPLNITDAVIEAKEAA